MPGGAGLIVRGGKAAKAGIEAASHLDEATDAARVIARGAAKEGIEQSLSKASLETVQRYGIKPYGEFGQPLGEGVDAAHHLVEKRFWRQLGFQSEEEGVNKILAVGIDKATHGPTGKGMPTITDEIRDNIAYRLGEGASPQRVWEAHRDVYRELGYDDWVELIWDVYFKHLPEMTK